MVSDQRLAAFVPSRDAVKSRAFYEGVLGLKVVSDYAFALTLDPNGTRLRLTKAPPFTPQPFTVLGWQVEDIRATANEMAARGVTFERFPGMAQDEIGIWTTPDGGGVAWFKDPEGNLLSIDQLRM